MNLLSVGFSLGSLCFFLSLHPLFAPVIHYIYYTLYSIYSNYLFIGSSISVQTSLLMKFYIKTFLLGTSSWTSCCQFRNSHCIFPVFCQFKQPNHPHAHQPNTRLIFLVSSRSFTSCACLELSKYKKCSYVKCFFPRTVAPCITLVDANR